MKNFIDICSELMNCILLSIFIMLFIFVTVALFLGLVLGVVFEIAGLILLLKLSFLPSFERLLPISFSVILVYTSVIGMFLYLRKNKNEENKCRLLNDYYQ